MKNMKNLFKNNLVSVILLIVIISVVAVIAGDVIVKEGAMDVEENFTVDTDTLFVDAGNDRVGVGITNPATPLTIKADSSNKIARFIENSGAEYYDVEVMANGNLLFKNDAGKAVLMLDDQSGHVTIGSDTVIQAVMNIVGGANEEIFRFKTTSTWLSLLPYSDDGLHWAENIVNQVTNGNLIFTHWSNRAKDHDHSTLSTDPTIFIHSSTDPDTANTEWGMFQFKGDGAGGGYWNFETGVGDMSLNPIDNVGIKTGSANVTYPLEVNADVSDISIYASKNISATGYITRTSVYDKSQGNALDLVKDADDYLTAGEIDHKEFYGYAGEFEITDYSRPETESFEMELINETTNETYYVPMERIIYPYTKVEEGVLLDAEVNVLRQAVYELKERLDEVCKKDSSYSWC